VLLVLIHKAQRNGLKSQAKLRVLQEKNPKLQNQLKLYNPVNLRWYERITKTLKMINNTPYLFLQNIQRNLFKLRHQVKMIQKKFIKNSKLSKKFF